MRLRWLAGSLFGIGILGLTPAAAQFPGGPPAVGVVQAEMRPITETSEFVGRIQAINRVALVARVTAFLEQQLFTEGTEVNKGDLLYVLEQPPFQADLTARQATVQQLQANLTNATIAYNRAVSLLRTPAGQQSTVDDSRATMLADAAQVQNAQAQVETSKINLGYTEIRAPISGKIGRTAVTIGNVVSQGSGTLTMLVSQDPMYVVFPVAVRTAVELRQHYVDKGGFNAVQIKIRLPDGRIYGQTGKLDFQDNTVSQSTDTIILRGTIPNPPLSATKFGNAPVRELVDGEFVTVLLEGVQPVQVLTVPRAAVLTDQSGNYVFTVDAQNKVQQTPVQLGQSTPTLAAVVSGLQPGDRVILDGVQRVHAGQLVSPGPASPPVTAAQVTLQGATGR
ncbi:MAG TPA: efflux RND transporter periplasmic adaptor subunit [Acetobacteraceae bacterium]|jgi:membrane fusion protein, multidrug efflux system|nr:efflux RND transporter periplasmic adaptor subunit [Acetobacteraceae bacterium]